MPNFTRVVELQHNFICSRLRYMITAMARSTFSVTMGPAAKELIDKKVRSGQFRGRSRAIEHYMIKGLQAELKEERILERYENQLEELMEVEQRQLDFLLKFFAAVHRNPEILETLREIMPNT